ncbi:MAG: dienelactone hydrolase family protein [Pirellulaceae bacterium]
MKFALLAIVLTLSIGVSISVAAETLPALADGQAPNDFDSMWAGFDPRAEPLEIEVVREWEEDDVILRIVRFRIGEFKGQRATLAAVYGFPKRAAGGAQKLPGLVQIHGGGQFADYKACLLNAKRGYATVSIAWAGRISAPNYVVNADIVKLFWDGKTDDPNYKLTTDWGAVDGYHAPGRNPRNAFPSARPAQWTLDAVESPRNSGWFLCAMAVRRALTFLEQQPEVNPELLGVYGHSMGGKLTVMASVDSRVKAAAPSCGGVSDRDNDSPLFRSTLGDDVSLKEISCPIIFLSPANDFHGRINDLPKAVNEIKSEDWRVTCSPHHSHQDTSQYEVATLLWFDQHLMNSFACPRTPQASLRLEGDGGVPTLTVKPDVSKPIRSVEVFYTQHGKPDTEPEDRENTMHRFWHYAKTQQVGDRWTASLPVSSTDKPLWVYANVLYELDQSVTGAGYYYRAFSADTFNLSSLLQTATPEEMKAAAVKATAKPTKLIESFGSDWEKEWFTYKPDDWSQTTHKLYDDVYSPPENGAPENVTLSIDVQSSEANRLVVLIDEYAATVDLNGGGEWQSIVLEVDQFKNFDNESMLDWSDARRLTLTAADRLKPKRGDNRPSRIVGKNWKGDPPVFRNLQWMMK